MDTQEITEWFYSLDNDAQQELISEHREKYSRRSILWEYSLPDVPSDVCFINFLKDKRS